MTKNKNSEKRSGRTAARPIGTHITTFSSRGASGGSSSVGNYDLTLNNNGNPFTGSQDGAFNLTAAAIAPQVYISPQVFNAYDYYRMKSCETTLTWKSAPSNSVVAGEVMFVIDRDDRSVVALELVANRDSLQTRVFNNSTLRHVISWAPHLVERPATFGVAGAQVDYVQPRDRWLNTGDSFAHRFGTLRLIGQVFDRSVYDNDAVLEIRHRVVFEFKGLKTVQGGTPGVAQEDVLNNPRIVEKEIDDSRRPSAAAVKRLSERF